MTVIYRNRIRVRLLNICKHARKLKNHYFDNFIPFAILKLKQSDQHSFITKINTKTGINTFKQLIATLLKHKIITIRIKRIKKITIPKWIGLYIVQKKLFLSQLHKRKIRISSWAKFRCDINDKMSTKTLVEAVHTPLITPFKNFFCNFVTSRHHRF